MELEIVLAIPATNECKILTNNSGAQGLIQMEIAKMKQEIWGIVYYNLKSNIILF